MNKKRLKALSYQSKLDQELKLYDEYLEDNKESDSELVMKKDKQNIHADELTNVTPNELELEQEYLDEFLEFIVRDINAHPERLIPCDHFLREGVDDLIKDVEIDLNEPLDDEDNN